jgi:hypothetical protein
VSDDVEVAVEEIDALAVHRQRGAAVGHPPALSRLADRALKAEPAQVVGPQPAAVVEPQAPVAVGRTKTPCKRAAQRHGHHTGDVDQPCGKLAHAAIQSLASGINPRAP